MLNSLCIHHFVLVKHLELDFKSGMTTFTGETGAGKSIMIDALMLALGGRADASVVRPGADKCEIHALFTFEDDTPPAHWLTAHDIEAEHHEIWLRRVINADGRSKAYINGHPFPLQKIKELSGWLVDIHGQHQHQRLLHHATHREQLDQYANHAELLNLVHQHHQACLRMQAELAELDPTRHTERADLLAYQINELNQLNPLSGEMEALHQEHQLLHHAKDYIQQTEYIRQILDGHEEQPGLNQQLHTLLHLTHTLPSDQALIKNAQECINNAIIQCEEAFNDIGHFSMGLSLDPDRLATVEARISELHQAARKYHIDASELLTHLKTLEQEQRQLQNIDEQRQRLQLAYQAHHANYQEAMLRLRESRQQHAPLLANEITQIMRQLGMPKGIIAIHITPLDHMHSHGQDKVEYHVCTNPGLALDTLSKIASGGELSRISLSIQLVTAQKRAATPTLLFDEVDVGIGGTTAALVGKLLHTLSQQLQVFCVTHQPQVACAADHHYRVEKYIEDDQSYSRVTSLTPTEKVHEIARMLGGLSITEQTLSHARALFDESHPTYEYTQEAL